MLILRLVSDCKSTGNSPTGREPYFKAKYGNWQALYHGPTFCTHPVSARRQVLKKQICHIFLKGSYCDCSPCSQSQWPSQQKEKHLAEKEDAVSGYMHVVSIKNYEVQETAPFPVCQTQISELCSTVNFLISTQNTKHNLPFV